MNAWKTYETRFWETSWFALVVSQLFKTVPG